jgi:hypothetical protein
MKKTIRRPVAALFAVLTAAGSLMVLLMGCGHKEDPPPANYYTGPMTPKSSGNPITQKTGPSTDAK